MQSNSHEGESTAVAHVQGVNATAGGLFMATIGAGLVAVAILLFVWLPAEHGFDPTGVGGALGLTEMGRIKDQLHHEAEADATASDHDAPSAMASPELDKRLTAIEARLAEIAVAVGAPANSTSSEDSAEASAAVWRDEKDYTLSPGEGFEVKLLMNKGAVAEYEWNANGAVVNHDTHGDGNGKEISYLQGRAVAEQAGTLTAEFDGSHGWFWRNRTGADVVITLRTRGDYKAVVVP